MEHNIVEEEYAAQLFSVRPSDIICGLQEDVIYCYKDKAKLVECLLNKLPEEVLSERDKEHGLKMLNAETSASINKTFNVLLDYFKKFIHIPEGNLLEDDNEQKIQHTLDDKKILVEELDSLRLQLANEKFMVSKLEEEAKEVNKVLEAQKNQLLNFVSKYDLSEIKENIIFANGNIQFSDNKIDGETIR